MTWKGMTPKGITINWHESMDTVPVGPTIVVANEFFDALPVQRFKFVGEAQGWREFLVNIDDDPQHVAHLCLQLADQKTQGSEMMEMHWRRKQAANPPPGTTMEL